MKCKTTKWLLIQNTFVDCTNFDPSYRPAAENIRYTARNFYKTVSDETSNSKKTTDHLGDINLASDQEQTAVDDKKKQRKVVVINLNIEQVHSFVSAR